VHVRSAGTAPAGEINPGVIAAMQEIGIDLLARGATPKPLTEAAVHASELVVTMGCGDTCPYYPGTRYEDWSFEDPAGKTLEQIRPIRDEIHRCVRELLDELTDKEGVA
jgi:protein-tyrosine-phosphatase